MTIIFVPALFVIVLLLQNYSGGRSLKELEASHKPDKVLVEPEEKFHIILRLENHSRFLLSFLRYSARIPQEMTVYVDEKKCHVDPRGEKFITGTIWLGPYQTLERKIPVSLAKRGRYLMRDMTVFSGDFLGFDENFHSYDSYREMVVYPKAVSIPRLEGVFGGFLGELSVRRFLYEDPVLTLGYREYSGREPMKTISWTQSARSGQLMVKNFDHTMEPTVAVVLNVDCKETGASDSEPAGTVFRKKEDLAECCFGIARSVCEQLEAKGIRYSFATNAASVGGASSRHYFAEGLGKAHFGGIMECLGRAFCTAEFSGKRLLDQTVRHIGAGHGVIFITPGDEAAVEQYAKILVDREGGTIMVLAANRVEVKSAAAKEMAGC